DLDLRREVDLPELAPVRELQAGRVRADHTAHLEGRLLDPELCRALPPAQHPAVGVAAARELVLAQVDALAGEPALELALLLQHERLQVGQPGGRRSLGAGDRATVREQPASAASVRDARAELGVELDRERLRRPGVARGELRLDAQRPAL